MFTGMFENSTKVQVEAVKSWGNAKEQEVSAYSLLVSIRLFSGALSLLQKYDDGSFIDLISAQHEVANYMFIGGGLGFTGL